MKRSLSLLMVSSFLALTACSNTADQVYAEMQASVAANAQAGSISEWHLSESNPKKVFEHWRELHASQQITSKDICSAMDLLNETELSLFEIEINKPENGILLTDCKTQLLTRLEKHWLSERAKLPTNLDNFTEKLDFSFKSNLQYRDTSNGYFAYKGDVAPGQVVITFDDGPSEVHTQTILATLKKVNAKAIFFEVGEHVQAHPELSKLVASEGHALGGHSMTHSCLGNKVICQNQNKGHLFTAEEAIAEINGSMNAIKTAVGWVDPFFRFPFGESSPPLKQYLQSIGVGEFYWSIDSEDWKAGKTPKMVVDDVMSLLKTDGRGVILFHDIQRSTAEALPELLNQLYNNGYQPVLLKPKPVN